jgi:hypothetical protein
MVKVSRVAEALSAFRVVVAVGAESIAQTSEHGGKTYPYHSTPKEWLPEMGPAALPSGNNSMNLKE